MLKGTKTHSKIDLCNICNGQGRMKTQRFDYNSNDYIDWIEVCDNCEGTGRVVVKTTIEVQPYEGEKEVQSY